MPRFRLLTSVLRVLPDCVILGEMRSGTTSLFRYLGEHPQVLQPWAKELHFFERLYANGTGWYRAHFPTRLAMFWHAARHGGRALTFEATPDYLIYPGVAQRMSRVVPGAKLIALVRNPADRAYAHYHFNVRFEGERHPFAKAIRRENKRLEGECEKLLRDQSYRSRKLRRYSYAARGIYIDHLRQFESHFSRTQMIIIKSEDLFERTQETYDEVLRFLGLAPWQLRHPESTNTARYSPEKPPGYDALREFFAPHNQRLYEYLGRDLGW